MNKLLTGKFVYVPCRLLKALFEKSITVEQFKELEMTYIEHYTTVPSNATTIPPKRTDVERYKTEIDFPKLDVDEFMDYYEVRGWKTGKNKMKNWQAAIRTWKRSYLKRNDLISDNQGSGLTECTPTNIDEARKLFGDI